MPQPTLPTWPVGDLTGPADLRVGIRPGTPPVVEVCGEIDIQSAPQLRLAALLRRAAGQAALIGGLHASERAVGDRTGSNRFG